MSKETDPMQRLLACGCMGTMCLFGLALTVGVILWIASILDSM